MNVKLHKVTLFVVSTGNSDVESLDQLHGDCYHNSGCRIVEIQTAEFDREWSDDDLLNKTTTMENRALLESLVKDQPVERLFREKNMGAWDVGPTDNDTAADLADDLGKLTIYELSKKDSIQTM